MGFDSGGFPIDRAPDGLAKEREAEPLEARPPLQFPEPARTRAGERLQPCVDFFRRPPVGRRAGLFAFTRTFSFHFIRFTGCIVDVS